MCNIAVFYSFLSKRTGNFNFTNLFLFSKNYDSSKALKTIIAYKELFKCMCDYGFYCISTRSFLSKFDYKSTIMYRNVQNLNKK